MFSDAEATNDTTTEGMLPIKDRFPQLNLDKMPKISGQMMSERCGQKTDLLLGKMMPERCDQNANPSEKMRFQAVSAEEKLLEIMLELQRLAEYAEEAGVPHGHKRQEG